MKIFKMTLVVCLALCLYGCIQRQNILTTDGFAEIPVGTSIKNVEDAYGEPYAIHSKGDGTSTFEYMEKIIVGRVVVIQKRYFFVVSNDKIVGKYMKYSNPPPYRQIYTDELIPSY